MASDTLLAHSSLPFVKLPMHHAFNSFQYPLPETFSNVSSIIPTADYKMIWHFFYSTAIATAVAVTTIRWNHSDARMKNKLCTLHTDKAENCNLLFRLSFPSESQSVCCIEMEIWNWIRNCSYGSDLRISLKIQIAIEYVFLPQNFCRFHFAKQFPLSSFND